MSEIAAEREGDAVTTIETRLTLALPDVALCRAKKHGVGNDVVCLNMANCGSCGDGKLNQALAMALPRVVRQIG